MQTQFDCPNAHCVQLTCPDFIPKTQPDRGRKTQPRTSLEEQTKQ